jgi:hypothetical protein
MGVWKRLLGRGRPAETPILVRDPDRPEALPNPTLAEMVRSRLRGDEIVFHWSELRRGEVTVCLISAEWDRVCREISEQCDPTGQFGREGGSGRSLHFALRDGQWAFVGAGDWVS